MEPRIGKAEGNTASEKYLQKLCERTFLSLWSFPSVFRDQGSSAGQRDGKELSDLLVVFDQHVLIFSDKACAYPTSENHALNWNRWFRKAIWKSAEQAWGAERWIRDHPRRIFLDRKCTQAFPFELPDPDEAVFHFIVVAHGVSPHIRAVHGGSGSLMLQNASVGQEAHSDPFSVGDLDPSRTFVHIFDEETISLLMQARDTISDFVGYLDKREKLFRGEMKFFAPGEEELLALYLRGMNSNGEHDFTLPFPENENCNLVFIAEGWWASYQNHPQRRAQLEADRISYSWDALIETFNRNTIAGTHYLSIGGIKNSERTRRFLAREPRYMRRHLATAINDVIANTPPNMRRIRVDLPKYQKDPHYVFVAFPSSAVLGMEYDQYRELRLNFLRACCMVVRLESPEAKDIIGLATEAGSEEVRSEDLLYLDGRTWTHEQSREAQQLKADWSILVAPERGSGKIREYPKIKASRVKRGRNDPCHCGSGLKFKKCCLRHT